MFNDVNYKKDIELLQGLLMEKLPEPTIDKASFLEDNFFPKQREYITCQSKYQTLFGSKRGGKSASSGGKIMYFDHWVAPEKPGYLIYASTTTEQAQRLVLKRLQQAEKGYDLNWHWKLGKNTIQTERNIILFAGLKDLKAVYSLQGLPIKLCIIDEPQFVKDEVLKTFILDVVSMGMIDFQGEASCCFVGNPFPVHSGYLWDMVQNQSDYVKHYMINLSDNTFFNEKQKIQFINQELEIRGETMDTLSNSSKRLIFGQWAEDDGHLVLSFKDKEKHIFDKIPNRERCDCIMGIDLGYDDKTAIAIMFYDPVDDIMYLDYEYQQEGMTIVPLVNKAKEVLAIYDTDSQNIIDTQGGGKQTAMTIRNDYGIPIIPAKKSDKIAWIQLLRSYNEMGKLKVKNDSALMNEARHIVFNKNYTKLDEDHFHSDIFHAVLYGFRFIYQKHKAIEKENIIKTPLEDMLDRIKKNNYNEKKRVEEEDYGL